MQPMLIQMTGGHRMRLLADALHEKMARFGYTLVETPMIQSAELFLTKAGDQIVSKLFTFDRHNQQLALRPEFTATAAFDYIRLYPTEHPVVRWQFSGPIFEDQPGASGHNYQHFSIGAELIGMAGIYADAEIIAMSALVAQSQGITDCTLVIGHVGLIRRLLNRFGLDPRTQRFLLSHLNDLKDPARGRDYVLERLERMVMNVSNPLEAYNADASTEVNTQQMLDALLDATQRNITMGGRSRHDIVRRLLQKRQRAAERSQMLAAIDFLEQWGHIQAEPAQAFETLERLIPADDSEARTLFNGWKETLSLLENYGIAPAQIRIQPDLARSWDYYTGLVFEVYAGSLHIAGGGRYDEMIRLVGEAEDVPAVGFVYYPEALIEILDAEPDAGRQPFRITSSGDLQATIGWTQRLRDAGISVFVVTSETAQSDAQLQPDNTLHWNAQDYSLENADRLIEDLKRA